MNDTSEETGERSLATQAEILNAAIDTFQQQGFHGTSIRAIAARAGVSIALIYYHFPSKEAILRLLMLRVTEELAEALRRALDSAPADPRDRLSALVRVHVHLHTERQAESFIANTELRALSPAVRAEVVAARDAISRLFKQVIADGVAKGAFHCDNVNAAALAILVMCTGVASWYRAGGPISPDALAGMYVSYALDMLRASRS